MALMFLLYPPTFYWDLAITLLIAFSFCSTLGCVIWIRRKKRCRFGKFLVFLIALVSTSAGGLVFYGSFVEPQIIITTEYTVDLPVTEPLTIAIVSDIHVGPNKDAKFVKRLVRTINDTFPDFVFLLGNYIHTEEADIADLKPLEHIRASVGVFGVLGNHDQGHYASMLGKRYFTYNLSEDISAALASFGVRMLRNEHEVVKLGTDSLVVAGIDDLWSEDADIEAALKDVPEELPVILLSHNPAAALNESSDVDLILSGHTHGGQIRIPFVGPVILPVGTPEGYDQGIISIDKDTTLLITHGVGETWGRARLFALPEVVVLTVE